MRWRLSVLVVVCSAVFGVGSAQADATAAPGLEFTDTSAIAVDGRGGNWSVDVEVCNSTSADSTIQLRFSGFAAEAGSTSSLVKLSGGASLTVDQVAGAVPAGECATVALEYTGGSTVSAASGELIAIASGGGLARRSVSVSAEPKATGSVADLQLSGGFAAVWGVRGSVNLEANALLLKYEGTTPPVIPSSIRIGTLASGDDSAEVWTTGASASDLTGLIRVPIEIRHASGQGTFTGSLDTKFVGSADKPVAVTVTVRDHWSLPLVVFLLGLLLTFAARIVSLVILPRKRLAAFRAEVGDRYTTEFARFATLDAERAKGFVAPSAEAINAFVKANLEATKRYARTTVTFDMTSDAVKAIREQIANANADADLLGDAGPGGLHAGLESLAVRLRTFLEFIDRRFDGHAPTALVTLAETSLGNPAKPTKIPVGGAQELITGAKAAADALEQWQAAAQRLRRLLRWWQLLDPKVPASSPEDRAALDASLEDLKIAGQSLVGVAKPGDAGQTEADRRLTSVNHRLLAFGARYDQPAPPNWEQTGDAADVPLDALFGQRRVAAEEHAAGKYDPLTLIGNLFEPDRPGPKWLMVVLEVFVLVVTAVVVAAITARLLYVDKAFGSRSDYLAILGAGIGAELIVTGVLAAVAGWRPPVTLPKLGP